MNVSAVVTGEIVSISEVVALENGGKKLSYRLKTESEYNNLFEFEIYKSEAYSEHVDNFVKYNKVGDTVEVEFNVRPRLWEKGDKVFTTLSHWKATKVDGAESQLKESEMSDIDF